MIQHALNQLIKVRAGVSFTKAQLRSRIAGYALFMARLSLGLTVIAIPLRYRITLQNRPLDPVYRDYTDILLFGSDVFMLLTLAFWGLGLALRPRRLRSGPAFLALPLLALTTAAALSTPFSVDPWLSAYHSLRLIFLALFYLYLVNEIRSLAGWGIPLGLQIYIQAAVGIGQILKQRSIGLHGLGELRLDPDWSGVSIVWGQGVRSLRAYGLSDHPNILGGCFVMALLLFSAWAITEGSKWRILSTGVYALGMVALFLTFSRAAWIAWIAGTLFGGFLLFKKGPPKAWESWIKLALAGVVVVLPFVWHNLSHLSDRISLSEAGAPASTPSRSISERLALNRAGNQIFAENALTGVGLGAFSSALRLRSPDFPYDYQPPHVVLLHVAAETGIFGALLYSALLLSPWLALLVNRERLKFSPALIGCSCALLAISLVGLFDYYPWLLVPGRLWQWIIWGLWAAVYTASRGENRHG